MKVVFITNYMTHHQLPFCLELYNRLGDDFMFIATNAMDDERKKMGWDLKVEDYPFIRVFEDYKYDEDIVNADVLLCGGTDTLYIRDRLKQPDKLTFRYFERLYKTGRIGAFSPRGYMRKLKEHTKYRNANVYLLCAGAYVPGDFDLFLSYPDKKYKWGYFTTVCQQSFDKLMAGKDKELSVLWTGRMIDWKHPLDAVKAFKGLIDSGVSARLTMIGQGPMRDEVCQYIKQHDLAKVISLHDFMSPSKVREYMQKSHIYLMTSDRQEGWGAVVNEAMDSGMVVIGSNMAGSVPYLIEDGMSGFIYKSGHIDELTQTLIKVAKMTDVSVARNAYDTMHELWSPKEAASRFLELSQKLIDGERYYFTKGPLSKAENIG